MLVLAPTAFDDIGRLSLRDQVYVSCTLFPNGFNGNTLHAYFAIPPMFTLIEGGVILVSNLQ